MPLEVFFIIIALIAYSIAIFAEIILKKLKVWMVVVLAAGFISDLSGTIAVTQKTGQWNGSFYAIAGPIVLLLMFALLVLAMRVLESTSRQKQFHRWAIWCWLLWALVFVSGIFKL